jgi:uncharacterized damage-inducible protein DinB
MTTIDEQGRPEPPVAAGEAATLLGFLDYQRATLEWKCAGLDAAALNAKTASSTLTLGGLLKHMTYVEDSWFSYTLHGQDRQPPWNTVDWKANPDWDFASAAGDSAGGLRTRWQDAVVRSRALVAEALADGGMDSLALRAWPDGGAPSLRWILCHLIEEYARHNGHADLLRESVDGSTGE